MKLKLLELRQEELKLRMESLKSDIALTQQEEQTEAQENGSLHIVSAQLAQEEAKEPRGDNSAVNVGSPAPVMMADS